MAVVTVKKPLREKLGDDGAEALVELINEAQKETQDNVIKFVEEKFEKRLSEELAKVRVEIAEVKTELIERIEGVRTDLIERIEGVRTDLIERIEGVRTDLTERIEGVRTDLTERIEGVRTELKSEIEALKTNGEKVKSELIRWMFIFWVGQIGAILGILFAFFKG